jgi:sec-independent protein translocase protein TatA
MFGHLPELLIILVLALIVFGPEKLPEVAATLGRAVRDVRQAMETAMNPEEEPVDFDAYYREYESHLDAEEVSGRLGEPETAEVWPGVGGTEGVEIAIAERENAAERVNGAHPPAGEKEAEEHPEPPRSG